MGINSYRQGTLSPPARPGIEYPCADSMIMTDMTFSAIAERALDYQTVQRRSQMSKTAFLARKVPSQDIPATESSPVCIVV